MMIKFPRRGGMLPAPRRRLVRRTLLGGALALAAGLAPAACATAPARGGPPEAPARGGSPEAVVQLTNDLNPPSDVSVYAEWGGGFRQLLGDAPPGGRQVLHLPLTGAAQTFRLVAERGLGRPVRSPPFVVTGSHAVIGWDLQANSLWFPRE